MRSLILILMLIAAASIVSLTAQAALAADEFGSPEALLFQEIPVVISATRTERSMLDVPNAVTVITAEEIRASGATSIVQMLAWVPGVELMRTAAGDTVLSIRGFNNPATSRVLTMIDGRSVYQDFFGIVLTDHLNVAMDEIERVEVIRGPGSALYGANAFLGTINIITKGARDLPRAKVRVAGGPRSTFITGVGAVSTDRLAIKGSFEHSTIEHFRNKTSTSVNVATTHRRGETASRSQKLNTTLEYKLSNGSELRLYGGAVNLKSDLFTDVGTWNFTGPRYDLTLDWEAGPWKFKTFVTHLDFDVRTIPPASSILPTAVPIPISDRIKSTTLDFELQRELQLGDHAVLFGLNTRRLVTSAPVILGAREAETLYAAFFQDEYSINSWLTAFVGARFDEHPKSGLAISPRVSAVAKLGEASRLRFSLARSFRNPSQIQNYLTLTTHNPPPIPVVVNGFEDLDPEWVTAYEIGFASVLHPRVRASVDLFYNIIEDFQILQTVGTALSWRNVDRTVNRLLRTIRKRHPRPLCE